MPRAFSYSQLSRSWFVKYKLYHLPFWFLYHYLWWVVTLGNPVRVFESLVVLPYALKYSFYVIFQALAVYFNLYYLIPRYLEKSQFATYIACLVLTVLWATLCIVGGYYFSAYLSGRTIADLYGQSACFNTFFSNALPSTVASTTLAMSIKLTKNWIQTRQRQQLLEKEKLEAELTFLKNQFNPHFLFNTINSIFFLIHKNPDMASESLAKFSGLLRYQLYECNDRHIPLVNEVTYLENFIELEKLRQNSNVTVRFESPRSISGQWSIAPFILLTFVENAVKHVSKHADKPNWIRVKLALDGQKLHFSVVNSTSPNASSEVIRQGGIGLKNVQRRLDLLYPEQYELTIQHGQHQFEVKLALTLSDCIVTPTLQIA
ncbi:sensor histidine kinase [Spirosoma radiotolerans]|uniref:Histidine kinase n=1 Tax=Spirosoma radiotolerans TaxID=1379870 RepID=A0A0E4A0K3_9BACT|nr:histidine kinase [Spirosoma radiotolerans]AKD58180.1 histidine kinase [Spirosoma radiotolerans]